MAWEVFYYQTERGESPIEDFLNSLPRKAKAKCIAYMDLLEEMGFKLPRSVIAKVRVDIWELRPEWAGTELLRRLENEGTSPIRKRTNKT